MEYLEYRNNKRLEVIVRGFETHTGYGLGFVNSRQTHILGADQGFLAGFLAGSKRMKKYNIYTQIDLLRAQFSTKSCD